MYFWLIWPLVTEWLETIIKLGWWWAVICYLTCRHKNIHHQLRVEICSDYLAPQSSLPPRPARSPGESSSTRWVRRRRTWWGGPWRRRRRRRRREGRRGGTSCCCLAGPSDRSRRCHHWTWPSSLAWAGEDPRRCRHTHIWGAASPAQTDCPGCLVSWGWRISGTEGRLSEWILTGRIIDVKRVPGSGRLAGVGQNTN